MNGPLSNSRIFSPKFVDFFKKVRIISSCMDMKKDCRIPECGDLAVLAKNKVIVGSKQLRKALENGRARCVYLAQNADPAITEPLEAKCAQRGIPFVWVRTMQDLGRACGIEVGAAAAAAVD